MRAPPQPYAGSGDPFSVGVGAGHSQPLESPANQLSGDDEARCAAAAVWAAMGHPGGARGTGRSVLIVGSPDVRGRMV